MSTYDFSTLYTTLPHNVINEKLLDLIERAFKKIFKNEGTLYLACNDKKVFFTSTVVCYRLLVIMWFLFGEVFSSSGFLGGLRYFIVTLHEPSSYFEDFGKSRHRNDMFYPMTGSKQSARVLFLFEFSLLLAVT